MLQHEFPSRAQGQGQLDLLTMYRRMLVVRSFETQASKDYRAGKIPGFVHLAIGQEACAVGATFHLDERDAITSTHRGHGHALAKGLPIEGVFAELMGRETGICMGRGGSMHIADPELGIFGANGIVGAGMPIAVGAGFAASQRGEGGAVVAFVGDGSMATGAFHEAANLISLWNLPVVIFLENNRFSEFSRYEDQHPVAPAARAAGYGIPYVSVDGNDVAAVADVMVGALAHVRAGRGPVFVEASTLRLSGHYDGDPQLYRRDSDGLDVRDPLDVCRGQLVKTGCAEADLTAIEEEVALEVLVAHAAAAAGAAPEPSTLFHGLLRDRPTPPKPTFEPFQAADDGESWKLFQAVGAALADELQADPSVFLAGIDVGAGGNVFGITRGFAERWPGRVLDTPISESAVVGLGVGSAMAGFKPIVEIMYFDFIGVCFDQIMNQAAKLPYMTGGRARMNLTIRTQFGAGKSSGAQHSQSLEALLAHIPGLTVVMPSCPADAYGLLRTAIQDPNPVIFVENRLQYGERGWKCDSSYRVPLGRAAIRRAGADLTIVSYSRMVRDCLAAADALAGEGVECDVIDLRTIAPLDVTTVLESVAKTNRLLIVHEAHRDFGVGAEIAAQVAENGIWYLDAPIGRVGAKTVPAPYAPSLEAEWLPGVNDIVSAARTIVQS